MLAALHGDKLSPSFYEQLHVIDPCCDAVYDSHEDAIVVWSNRKAGITQHELTVKRECGENYGPLERRTLQKLKECDVWKRFKSADEFDDYLEEQAKTALATANESARKERLAKLKDERDFVEAAIWNAQHGRFTKETVLPYETKRSTTGHAKVGGIKKLEDLK